MNGFKIVLLFAFLMSVCSLFFRWILSGKKRSFIDFYKEKSDLKKGDFWKDIIIGFFLTIVVLFLYSLFFRPF